MGDLYKKWSGKFGPITCSILTGIVLAVPISTIVMGAIHLDNCPAERYIPIYLIVSGCFSIVLSLFRVLGAWTQDEEGQSTVIQLLSGLISSFLFCWFIAGNVWIYRINNTYNPTTCWLQTTVTTPSTCLLSGSPQSTTS